MAASIRAVIFEKNQLKIIDQTLLPGEEKYLVLETGYEVFDAIRTLKVRGAPAIGIAAAYGLFVALKHSTADNFADFYMEFHHAKALLASARPTAVNLFRALDRQEKCFFDIAEDIGYSPSALSSNSSLSPDCSDSSLWHDSSVSSLSLDSSGNSLSSDSTGSSLSVNHAPNTNYSFSNKLQASAPAIKSSHIQNNSKTTLKHFQQDIARILSALSDEAVKIQKEEEDAALAMGEFGLSLLKPGMGILTHCNAGALAAAGYGTALSPIHLGRERGYGFKVFAGETRPLLQGARLTAWELMKSGIDVTLICDNMASAAMSKGWIQAVLTGCDRMAANGDGANKIGTSALAILAKNYGIPFYMFVPTSTIDMSIESGDSIPIELREGDELSRLWFEKPMAPEGVKTWNPAFDITTHEYITAVITEKGIVYPPFCEGLKKVAAPLPLGGSSPPSATTSWSDHDDSRCPDYGFDYDSGHGNSKGPDDGFDSDSGYGDSKGPDDGFDSDSGYGDSKGPDDGFDSDSGYGDSKV